MHEEILRQEGETNTDQYTLRCVKQNLKYLVGNNSGVPRNFVQLRTERTGIWGAVAPSQGFWRQL